MRLDGLYGNEALKARLSAAFDSGRVAHSYLLCGPAGAEHGRRHAVYRTR